MSKQRIILASAILLVAASPALAVNFGWEAQSGGGIEYIVEVEPDLLDNFRAEGITSEIPPGLRDVRRIRLVVGTEKLPNQGDITGPQGTISLPPPPDSAAKSAPPAETPRIIPPLHFLQPGTAKNINESGLSGKPAEKGDVAADTVNSTLSQREKEKDGGSVTTAWPGERTEKPQLNGDERHTFGMPTTPDVGAPNGETLSRPWLPLMLALLALFASLGANLYLVWIHQDVRAKYRELASAS